MNFDRKRTGMVQCRNIFDRGNDGISDTKPEGHVEAQCGSHVEALSWHKRKMYIRILAPNAATTLLALNLIFVFQNHCCIEACQFPLRPIYNATVRQYVSCNAWEPECPAGSYCQMATNDWKNRLQINIDHSLFLCCADEAVFRSSQIAPPKPPFGQPVKDSNRPDGLTTPAPVTIPSIGNGIGIENWSITNNNAFNGNGDNLSNGEKNVDPWNGRVGDKRDYAGNANANGNMGAGPETTDALTTPPPVSHQPANTPRPPNASGPGAKNPVLPPQAQIMLPGNGNRVVEGPQVIQLVVGEIQQSGPDGMFKYSGSVSLVQDSGLNILIDSGSAQNRNKLLGALAQQGIRPQNIQFIVYTHAHPDHIGNDNLFPYAQKMYSTTVYKGDEYMPLQYLQEPSMRLTQNVEVWQTPGHTFQHNSVIVRNVPNDGSVAISGDLFMSEEGISNPIVWQTVSVDKDTQAQMRNIILCQVDHIIPGHGAPFRVTPEHKSAAACATRRKVFSRRNHRMKSRSRTFVWE